MGRQSEGEEVFDAREYFFLFQISGMRGTGLLARKATLLVWSC